LIAVSSMTNEVHDRLRMDQSGVVEQRHFDVRVASTLADAYAAPVDGHTAADDEVDGLHLVQADPRCQAGRSGAGGGHRERPAVAGQPPRPEAGPVPDGGPAT
jgi:hypothetical protein